MRDLDLWQRLQDGASLDLLPGLTALGARPLAERVPFLGRLGQALKSEHGALRQAALAALSGADGPRAMQHMVDAFDDVDPAVRAQALESFFRSTSREPQRRVHALFHPSPEIRSLAAGRSECADLAVFVLADPACQAHRKPLEKVAPAHTPTVLEWLARGVLDRESGRRILGDTHLGWLLSSPGRPRGLEQICQLFWDDEPVAEQFWSRVSRMMERRSQQAAREVLTEALSRTGRAQAVWPEAACRLLFEQQPLSLTDSRIPRSVRHRGLRTLFRSGLPALEEEPFQQLLSCDLLRTAQGGLDLWATGALLCLASHPESVLADLPEPELHAAATRYPHEAAFLMLATRHHLEKRRSFAHRLSSAVPGCGPQLAAGLLAAGDGDGAAYWLQKQPVFVARALFELEGRPGFELSEKRRISVADFLSQALVEQPETLLLEPAGPLAVECLAQLSRAMEPESFAEACRRLRDDDLARVLQAIDGCPAFAYPTEGLLAQSLSSHQDPRVRSWVQARTAEPEPVIRRVGGPVARLTQAQRVEIAHCPEADLPDALQPALASPSRGLADCLAERPQPSAPVPRAVLALLGCHDDLASVAAEMARFHEPGGDLDHPAAQLWSMQPELPFHGHVFIHRFDFHIDRVESALENLQSLLELAERLHAPLPLALWKMMARLCARWRYRDRAKLHRMASRAFVEGAVRALEGPCQVPAATCLAQLWAGEAEREALQELRPQVESMLPDLEHATRMELTLYVNSRGLSATTVRRRGKPGTEAELAEIRRCTDLRRLAEICGQDQGTLVAEAALRLLDFGETGAGTLLQLILKGEALHTPLLAETAGLWPDGPARKALVEKLGRDSPLEAEVVFLAGLSLWEVGEPLGRVTLEAARRPSATAWFLKTHWDRLLRCGIEADSLALELASSPHPHAYTQAVEWALGRGVTAALASFLEAGSERHRPLRLKAARALWDAGDKRGFPLLFVEALELPERARELTGVCLKDAVTSVMLAGPATYQERALLNLVLALPDPDFQEPALTMLHLSRRPESCQALLHRLPRSSRRQDMLSRVAHSFAWGVKMGRQLTGRLFQVEMHGGEELGFTNIDSSRIHINPLPMFRSDRHGREIVEGLILHELGHHVYHRGKEAKAVWDRAQKEGLFRLLNLVCDEHLERNIRSMERDFDLKLKRLAAYAFLHDRREVDVGALLQGLQHRAMAVLSASALKIARRPGCVSLRSGEAFSALEKNGGSFARFVRGLRTGRGNRYGDPLVAEALGLFKPAFRRYTMEQHYEIARRLLEIFGQETELLQVLAQDGAMCPDASEVIVVGENLTPEEMRRELERIAKGETDSARPASRWINKNSDLAFPPLTTVVPVQADPVKAREYMTQVARFARHLRDVFRRLGLAYHPQKHRLQGRRVERARLPQAVLRGEMRILQARKLVVSTDLFLGVLVDCSGSMNGDCIHKARLFATLVAQAARGLPGLDLRVLGFTDAVVYDAGDAARSTAYNLEAAGGNNDAGALDFAAHLARRSHRRARLLIMISDGLPTQCSVAALAALVDRLSKKEGILCAQVAVRPLTEICFPHYMELSGEDDSLGSQVAEFGRIVARLTYKSLR